ncbi:MAG: TIGR03667 family PPOX class F420-dependent oxidoreductase [Chloroflexi bacterium]|nr:TIGR03667 family PPOX class F420-dependent oxidoreductase [Chloroflexota bacterium]
MLNLDLTSAFGERVARRLREERIIWLVTIDPDDVPQPTPVWFWWDGETVLIYSHAKQAKLRNIRRHPQVALHLDGDGQGGDIIVFTGTARLAPDAPPAHQHAAYAQKYQWGFDRIGTTPEQFAADYAVALRVTPEKVRGH